MNADPFDTLGLEPVFDLDLAAAERRYRELSKVVHPDRFTTVSGPERRRALSKAVDVNEAWRRLRDPIARAESPTAPSWSTASPPTICPDGATPTATGCPARSRWTTGPWGRSGADGHGPAWCEPPPRIELGTFSLRVRRSAD